MPPVVVGRMYIDNALFQLPATVGGDNIDITDYGMSLIRIRMIL